MSTQTMSKSTVNRISKAICGNSGKSNLDIHDIDDSISYKLYSVNCDNGHNFHFPYTSNGLIEIRSIVKHFPIKQKLSILTETDIFIKLRDLLIDDVFNGRGHDVLIPTRNIKSEVPNSFGTYKVVDFHQPFKNHLFVHIILARHLCHLIRDNGLADALDNFYDLWLSGGTVSSYKSSAADEAKATVTAITSIVNNLSSRNKSWMLATAKKQMERKFSNLKKPISNATQQVNVNNYSQPLVENDEQVQIQNDKLEKPTDILNQVIKLMDGMNQTISNLNNIYINDVRELKEKLIYVAAQDNAESAVRVKNLIDFFCFGKPKSLRSHLIDTAVKWFAIKTGHTLTELRTLLNNGSNSGRSIINSDDIFKYDLVCVITDILCESRKLESCVIETIFDITSSLKNEDYLKQLQSNEKDDAFAITTPDQVPLQPNVNDQVQTQLL